MILYNIYFSLSGFSLYEPIPASANDPASLLFLADWCCTAPHGVCTYPSPEARCGWAGSVPRASRPRR